MTTDKDFDLRLAEEYGKVQAIVGTLLELADKVKVDPGNVSTKTENALEGAKIHLSGCSDGISSLREDTDTLLEKCVLVLREIGSLDAAVRKLGAIRTKLCLEGVSKTDCSRYLEDLETIKTSLEKRYQIRKVDSEKQASVSSLTEQLKQKELQIEQLNKSLQERDSQLQEIQKHLAPETPK